MKEILDQVRSGEISPEEAERLLTTGWLGIGEFARLDVSRESRTGIPEVVLAEGKRPEEVVAIAEKGLEALGRVIVSRVGPDLSSMLERSIEAEHLYRESARIHVVRSSDWHPPQIRGSVGIITGGTSDIPVADECQVIVEEMGCVVRMVNDAGVAGIQRLYSALEELGWSPEDRRSVADVYVVAAGREGTLPTVVSGLVDRPVIGLPVSTGYGMGGNGVAALLTMLQSCSPVVVVNIDAGVVAGLMAARIARLSARDR